MISRATYNLLTEMVGLAEKREPVQGDFYMGFWNSCCSDTPLKTKDKIQNCGTAGCLAGGYLPLIDNNRFYFDIEGEFYDGNTEFYDGRLVGELGKYGKAIFFPESQQPLKLPVLYRGSTKEEVIENAKKVLELMKKRS